MTTNMKHKESYFRILAESDNGYIGECECCHEFNFAFKTVLLTFQEEELHQFFAWLISSWHSPECYMPLRHGRNRVFASPHSNLFLTYNDQELDEITHLYNETVILLEAQKAL